MYDISIYRNRCQQLIDQTVISGNHKQQEKLQNALFFLSDDHCFVGARIIHVIYLMNLLGYDRKEAHAIYQYYNQVKPVEGTLEYSDKNGKHISINTLVNPDAESYYQFTDDNIVFKYSQPNQSFYRWHDGNWRYDGGLSRKINDVQYDYEPIKCTIKENSHISDKL